MDEGAAMNPQQEKMKALQACHVENRERLRQGQYHANGR